MASPAIRASIWCRVIDNYGDAGVSWRLARSLAAERGWRVTLYIDRPEVLRALRPGAPERGAVTVRRWDRAGLSRFTAAVSDVVIESFSCRLPDEAEAAIAARARERPVAVFAVDYLSAEAYAGASHGLDSPHPRYGYHKIFVFPGFAPEAGGLVRERRPRSRRDGSERDLLIALGADSEAPFTAFFFSYPAAPVEALAAALAVDPRPAQLLLAPGEASRRLSAALRRRRAAGRLRALRLPLLPQDDLDRLLRACDTALARGEDSAARAQLLAVPLIWSLYRQEESAHLNKLSAFADRYVACLDGATGELWRRLNRGWNGDGFDSADWLAWRDALPALRRGARDWRRALLAQPSVPDRVAAMARAWLRAGRPVTGRG